MKVFLKEIVKGFKFELLIDTKIFSKDIVLKAAYNFLDKGYFLFSIDDDKNIIIQFTTKDWVLEKPENIIWEFSDELLNVYLRDKLEKDNKDIREKIVWAAIANSLETQDFIELNTDENINQDNNQIDFDKDIDEILREIENDPELKIDEEEIERILKEIEEESGDSEKENKKKKNKEVDIDKIIKEIENDPELKIDEEEIERILKEIEEESKDFINTDDKPGLNLDINALKGIKEKFKKDENSKANKKTKKKK